jgi:hypothetical protein
MISPGRGDANLAQRVNAGSGVCTILQNRLASEAGDHTYSPQRKLWVQVQQTPKPA